MRCAGCGFEAPADFAFCPRCGARLVASEETRQARPSDRTPAADAAADEADRRLVTVLFADVSGFTALAERLDPEDVREFQGDLFREMESAIARYEGFVEKFVGDAVVAVFGAPLAHEDDPERALRAALEMFARMAALDERWARRLGAPLALHVGVNTGPVVAGSLGASAAYAVTGDTVNTASRIQGAAEPGQILVGVTTYRLTQHAFAFEPLGELRLKGKAETLPIYRLVGALETPRAARGLEAHGLVAPLVGRAEELDRLLAAFDAALGGRAQVVSVIGEAGAGKSRLITELLAALARDGRRGTPTVRRTACAPLGEPTYGVLARLCREAYRVDPGDALEVARQKLAGGLRLLGAEEEVAAAIAPLAGYLLGLESGDLPRDVEPEQLKRQMFLAVRMLFEHRLRQGPLLVVAEDLHWADAASVELLAFVVDQLAERPLMLLVAHRPGFDARALEATRAAYTAIRLAPLSAGESDALLGALFGPAAHELPARLRELVVGRAGGNPFYLEEVVRGLIAAGVLVRGETGWRCAAEASGVDVPPTLQGLLLSRLDRLPAAARRLAQEAAVLGPVFDERLLRMVSEADAVETSLRLLQEAELLEVEPRPAEADASPAGRGRRYRFRHALGQEAVYQNVLVRRRTELHGRAGQVLERLCGGAPERLEDLEALGHHFGLSADRPRGARYLVAAGDWARGIYANDDAVRHYERALGTLRECGGCDAERLAVRERLGDVLALVGRRGEALPHYEAARSGHAAAGERPAQARAWRKIGGLRWDAGERDEALACFRSGLALLEGQADQIELAHLYQAMGRLAFRSGDNRAAVEWAERALRHAEQVAAGATAAGSPTGPDGAREAAAAVAHACNTLGVALARLGRLEDAVARIERSVAVAEGHALLQAACRGYTNLGVLYSTLDPGRAIETCQRGLETAKRIGDLGFQSRLYANLAVAYCALTNRCEEQGMGAAQAAIELDRRLGQLDHLAIPLIVLGQIHQCHGGSPELALRCYREALALAEGAGEPQLLFPCYDGLATMYLELGDEAEAERYMLKAREVCERAGLEPDSFIVLPFLD